MARVVIFAIIFSITCWGQIKEPDGSGQSSSNLPDSPSAQLKLRLDRAIQNAPAVPASAGPQTLADNTATIALLSEVSSKAPTGSSFLARLQGPVATAPNRMLPEGTLLEGHLDTQPARRLLKPGSLRMIFDLVKLPDGTIQRANISLVGVVNNSNVKADSEGKLRPTVSKKRLAIELGGTALIAKVADDVSEEAVSASVGRARLYGMAAGGIFLALQKGREVKLRSGDVIEVQFGRAGEAIIFDDVPKH